VEKNLVERIWWVARAGLSILLIASLSVTLWQGWRLVTGWPGSALIDRGSEEIAVELDRAIARHVDAPTVIARLEELLLQDPRAWVAIEALEQVAESRDIELPPDLVERRNDLHDKDTGLLNTSSRCALCAWDPRECDFSAILLCRAPIDFTPLGDLTGVIREGTRFALGQEVDSIDLGLSAVGLTAVALAPFSGGSSYSLKLGAGAAKMAWRMGRLSENLIVPVRRALKEGFDWLRVYTVRSYDDLVALARPKVLRPALVFASDLGRMNSALGPRKALYLLSSIETPVELRRFANAAEGMGTKTLGAFEALGKTRFIRVTVRWSDEIWWTVTGVFGLMTSLLGLLWNVIVSVALRLLRRLARDRKQKAD